MSFLSFQKKNTGTQKVVLYVYPCTLHWSCYCVLFLSPRPPLKLAKEIRFLFLPFQFSQVKYSYLEQKNGDPPGPLEFFLKSLVTDRTFFSVLFHFSIILLQFLFFSLSFVFNFFFLFSNFFSSGLLFFVFLLQVFSILFFILYFFSSFSFLFPVFLVF